MSFHFFLLFFFILLFFFLYKRNWNNVPLGTGVKVREQEGGKEGGMNLIIIVWAEGSSVLEQILANFLVAPQASLMHHNSIWCSEK